MVIYQGPLSEHASSFEQISAGQAPYQAHYGGLLFWQKPPADTIREDSGLR